MLYNDFTVTIAERTEAGYPVFAVAQGLGRVTAILPPPDSELKALLARVASSPPAGDDGAVLREAGRALFRWLGQGPVEGHLRIAWDRAGQMGRGLRLRLSIDPPEISAWPWELLWDPQRDHWFATSTLTPLVRFLDQADRFGGLVDQQAEWPLKLLLVLPYSAELDLALEHRLIEEALAPLRGALHLHVLEGIVTRAHLADALLLSGCDIVHFAGHGGFVDGKGYIVLNQPDGSPDWVDDETLARLTLNHCHLKLVVLNTCSGGRVDDARAFGGLTPALLRRGLPAVIAMQYPLSDQMGAAFAREFYRRLCLGENAGRVDVAVTHARNMLAICYPGQRGFAAPVLYTHTPDSVIFSLAPRPILAAADDSGSELSPCARLVASLESSTAWDEDWALADRTALERWRERLEQAQQMYQAHLSDPTPEARQAAGRGLALIQRRLAALDAALALAPSSSA